MQVASLVRCSALLAALASCQTGTVPSDFRMETLNPGEDVRRADTIVLAYPTARRELRTLLVPRQPPLVPLPLAEVETTLEVTSVLKGSDVPRKIRFRFYEGRSPAITGPPQGASGHIGERGIFFLHRGSDSTYRPVVDVYRPDIATRWITSASRETQCADPSDCIAVLLLTIQPEDDAGRFTAALPLNVVKSRQLVGFLRTLDLLDALVEREHPGPVQSTACAELSGWYPIEVTHQCVAALSGRVAGEDISRLAKVRDELHRGGLPWLRTRVHPQSDIEMKRYLKRLMLSDDGGTREEAARLEKLLP